MGNLDIEQQMNGLRRRTAAPPGGLGDNFEDCVFSKIKKHKTRRTVAASAALGFVFAALLFAGQALFFQPPDQTPMLAENSRPAESLDFPDDNYNPRLQLPPRAEREEMPVMEDIVFASSDSRSGYAIEQVAYYKDNETI